MSEALTPDAPEAAPAVTSVEDPAPGDGTAVAAGSAGESDEWKHRFDGLMASSQRRETELRTQLEALTTRINSQETTDVADEAILAKLEAMEARAKRAEREAVLNRVLSEYPDAVPFSDLIQGDTPEEIESVAQAIAIRAQALKPVEVETPPAGEEVTEVSTETPPAGEAAPEAPVIGGTASAPVIPTDSEAVETALKSRSWSDYWTAKVGPAANANLG